MRFRRRDYTGIGGHEHPLATSYIIDLFGNNYHYIFGASSSLALSASILSIYVYHCIVQLGGPNGCVAP